MQVEERVDYLSGGQKPKKNIDVIKEIYNKVKNFPWHEMPDDGDRDMVCDSYEIFFPRKFSLHDRIDELRGKVLGCWCYPQKCHGDYFAAKLQAENL